MSKLPPDLPEFDIEEPSWQEVAREGVQAVKAGRKWYSPTLWASIIFPKVPGLAQFWARIEKKHELAEDSQE